MTPSDQQLIDFVVREARLQASQDFGAVSGVVITSSPHFQRGTIDARDLPNLTNVQLGETRRREALRQLLDPEDLIKLGAAVRHRTTHMIQGIFELGNKQVHDVMVPRTDIRAIDVTTPSESALALYASPLEDLRTTPTVSYLRDLLAVTAALPDVGGIDAPVLALISRDSTMTDPRRTRAVLSAFRNLTCVDIPARHWIPTEEPVALRQAVEDWLLHVLEQGHEGEAHGQGLGTVFQPERPAA